MSLLKKILPAVCFISFIVWVFYPWFSSGILSGGDWWANYADIANSSWHPWVWMDKGMGQLTTPFMAGMLFSSLINYFLGQLFHLPPEFVQRIGFFYPLLILSTISPHVLYKYLFPESKFGLLASFLFLFNTYVLMLISGGQIFIALSLAVMPFTLLINFSLFENLTHPLPPPKEGTKTKHISHPEGRFQLLRKALIPGLLLSLQTLLDLKVAYMTIAVVVLWYVFQLFFLGKWRVYVGKNFIGKSILLLLPFIMVALLHSFWLIPAVLIHHPPAPEAKNIYTAPQSVHFFSFAKFENSFGLLHPNWPHNIFGKVGFMKPEFLILPILSFSSLLFIKKKNKQSEYVMFFALLALIGTFLAKGTQEPFGGIYSWLFTHVPGFIMFRDPTKWYGLILIAYVMLIPFSIEHIANVFGSRLKAGMIVLCILFLLFLIRPALNHQLTGTSIRHTMPKEYEQFNVFISRQHEFFRTLWLPHSQRYAFSTPLHPINSGSVFFADKKEKEYFVFLKTNAGKQYLQERAVKYIVLPSDPEHELYLRDGKYTESIRTSYIKHIKAIPWIISEKEIGNIWLFEVPAPKDHFWVADSATKISYIKHSPVAYTVRLTGAKKGERLVFSEGYDTYWQAKIGSTVISSQRYHSDLNSFILPKNGNYTLEIYYEPQTWTNIGFVITIVVLAGTIGTIKMLKYEF